MGRDRSNGHVGDVPNRVLGSEITAPPARALIPKVFRDLLFCPGRGYSAPYFSLQKIDMNGGKKIC